ncbi:MAG: SCO family protein [Acidimicrobiales bacterium]|nr:SCO family protein [Acidimicrobiales bacterium]MCB9394835.1 SCO family protein [Acidimicrobiaceae bacterium]
MPRWAKVAASVLVVLVVAAMSFAIFKPIKVLPRIRLAPGFALVDQRGEAFISEDTRGDVTIYTFVPSGCADDCQLVYDTVRDVMSRLGTEVELGDDLEVRFVTIVQDAVDATVLASLATDAGADGDQWRFVSGTDTQLDTVVGLGFRHARGRDTATPHFVIVDGWGTIRGDYRYRTSASESDKLVRHVDLLVSEVQNSSGIASLAYGAAHVFMCYP